MCFIQTQGKSCIKLQSVVPECCETVAKTSLQSLGLKQSSTRIFPAFFCFKSLFHHLVRRGEGSWRKCFPTESQFPLSIPKGYSLRMCGPFSQTRHQSNFSIIGRFQHRHAQICSKEAQKQFFPFAHWCRWSSRNLLRHDPVTAPLNLLRRSQDIYSVKLIFSVMYFL